MAELPEGYRAIPEAEQRKANAIFDRAAVVAKGGNYDYAIELYINGLAIDPENVEAHQALRDISLQRKMRGGKGGGLLKGLFGGLKLGGRGKDDKETMLNSEKALAMDPGNTNYMEAVMDASFRAGFYDTTLWIAKILLRANNDSAKPDYNKYINLKNTFKALERYKEAADAAQLAARLRPENMELAGEMKNLAAEYTMSQGKYESAKSFRDSIRDMGRQKELLDQDKGITSSDMLARQIEQAEVEYQADPNEAGKLMKLVDALARTEDPQQEQRAIDLLGSAFEQTGQFRFRFRQGQIRLAQLSRQERALRTQLQANPNDASLKQQYAQVRRAQAEEELQEYSLAAENYPTNMEYRYHQAVRLFQLGRYQEAIPLFQQARQDPKYRTDSGVNLGRAFLEAGFQDEAVDTLREMIETYELRGDPRSKEMHYWYGRALEQKGDTATALRSYSQVAQWDFNYRDVQNRIRNLRAAASGAGGA